MKPNYNTLSNLSVIELNTITERYKSYRQEWNKNPMENIVSSFPLNIDIELTNACNLRCPHCARTSQNWGTTSIGFMDENLVVKILDEVDKEQGYCVKFSLRGEPLLYKNLENVLLKAKKTSLVDYYFNTNAVLLTPDISKKIVELELPRISISVGGWDKKSFENCQVGASFETILNNLNFLKKYRDENKKNFPKIRLQGVLTPLLKQHLDEFKDLWKDFGDELGCVDFREESDGEIESTKEDKNFRCNFLWQRLVVLWNGDVYPCLFHGVKNVNELVLGNIKNNTLKELWHSDKLQTLRQLHTLGNSHLCVSCRLCSYRKEEINLEQ